MKKFIFLMMVVAVAGLVRAQEVTSPPMPPTEEETLVVDVGDVAPDFEVAVYRMTDVVHPDSTMTRALWQKATMRLSDLRGKTVLVTFWATWCPDCRAELRNLVDEVLPKLETDENFVFLPISTRERGKDQTGMVGRFMELNDYTFLTGLDNGTIYLKYATNYVPRNFLIDSSGVIIATSTDVGFKEKIVEKLMEVVK